MPSEQRVKSERLPGYRACQVHLGNYCNPHMGTDTYQCHCLIGRWRNDNSRPFPNCFRFVTKCDGRVCHNGGRCFNSRDATVAVCHCTSMWTGPRCESASVNFWLLWEPWSQCSVTCGQGWRSRRRICRTGNQADCAGNWRDLEPCRRQCRPFSDRYRPWLRMCLLLHASLAGAMLLVVVLYVRLRADIRSQYPGDKAGVAAEDSRKMARWFAHRNRVIRSNINSMHRRVQAQRATMRTAHSLYR